MTVTVVIPVIERAELTEGVIRNLDSVLELDSTSILIIDNSPPQTRGATVRAIERANTPRVLDYRVPEHNLGVFKSVRMAAEYSTSDILALIHWDTRMLSSGFDRLLVEEFDSDPKLGLAGLVGATGVSREGDWTQPVYSRITHRKEMATVGAVTVGEPTPDNGVAVACLDGCGMFFRRELMAQLIDVSYPGLHHWYDKDMSCSWLAAGWHIKALPIGAYHGLVEVGATSSTNAYLLDSKARLEELGLAAYSTQFPNHDIAAYDLNHRYWKRKWSRFMPVTVDANYNVTWETPPC